MELTYNKLGVNFMKYYKIKGLRWPPIREMKVVGGGIPLEKGKEKDILEESGLLPIIEDELET